MRDTHDAVYTSEQYVSIFLLLLIVLADNRIVVGRENPGAKEEAHLIFPTRDLRFFQSLISAWPAGPGLAPVKLLRAVWGCT